MPQSQLLEMVTAGDLDGFEGRCLDMIESGEIPFAQLARPLQELQKRKEDGRAETLGRMLLEAAGDAQPAALLPFLSALLNCCPDVEDFRQGTLAAYRAVHGDAPTFAALLEASGLEGSRPARRALKLLDTCLPLREGSNLIGFGDDKPAVVIHVDESQALYTLKTDRRVSTLAAAELVAEYEPVDADDFRVLKSFHPERLVEMAASDPVKLVVNMIHAHGEALDADVLKEQLTPRVVAPKDWSGWWTKVRAKLKRCPNVIIEGRSPVHLTYTEYEVTVEDETRDAFSKTDQPVKWLALIESYLKEKRRQKVEPNRDLLEHLSGRMHEVAAVARERRPSDALAIALVLDRLREQGFPFDEATAGLAGSILGESQNAVRLIAGLSGNILWERAVVLLRENQPDDSIALICKLVPRAPDAYLDKLIGMLIAAEAGSDVQRHIDATLADPVHLAGLMCWLWKGSQQCGSLNIPPPRELLTTILGALSALARSEGLSAEQIKHFRAKMKAALGHRDYRRFREVIERIDEPAAITMRRQIERMDGLGDNVPKDMLRILRERHPQLWKVYQPEPWEDPEVLWTTQAGMTAKKAAIDDLVNVKMHENAKAIGAAAEHGDLSENSEYKFALEERDMLRARLAQMNEQMAKARVFESSDVPGDHVGVGSRVTIVEVDGGMTRVMTFFGPWEADVEKGLFNYLAPVGQKLMGCHVGDRIRVMFEGKEREFEVRDFANGFDDLLAGRAPSALNEQPAVG